MFERRSITGLSFFSTFAISFALLVLLGVIWVYIEYQAVRADFDAFRDAYITGQKQLIKKEVDNVRDYIAYSRSLTEKRVRENIKKRVEEAYSIAEGLYLNNKDTLDLPTLEKVVREALRPIRFNNGRGYFFATRLDGVEQLFADRPELEGRNMSGMRDTQGNYVIRNMIDLARKKGEGFYSYTWTKPGEQGKDFQKIAYIKYFEPFDWFIGTGEYTDGLESTIQQEVLDRIGQIRFGNDGYIFVVEKDGKFLSHIDSKYVGRDHLEIVDPNGVVIGERLQELAGNNDGGYLNYVWAKPSTGKLTPKLGYARAYSPWNWMIGTGIYLDDIEGVLNSSLEKFRQRIMGKIIASMCLFGVALLLLYLNSSILSKRIHKGINQFRKFFEKAVTSHEKIVPEAQPFSEFQELARRANVMVDDMIRSEKELADLNSHLEELVDQRTQALVAKTEELEQANQKLVELDEMKSSFISLVTHELRTPLTSIFGFTKIIGRDVRRYFSPLTSDDAKLAVKTERILNNLSIMDQEGKRLGRLIEDVLDLSKIESGMLEWREELVDPMQSIKKAIDSVSGQIPPRVMLLTEMSDDLPKVIFDPDRLVQVLLNLIGNALKFMEYGRLTVSARDTGDGYLEISVSDSGPGIPREMQEIIFDRFRQADSKYDYQGRPRGTGLGLAISKQIVEHFNGSIRVESEPGEGSTFSFTIPVA